MTNQLQTTAGDDEANTAKCHYTGFPVETPNDVEVSISRHVVLKKIADGETRLTD